LEPGYILSKSCHGLIPTSIEDQIRKISDNDTINIYPNIDKLDKGLYIRDYFGKGSYSIMSSGHIVVIVNDIDDVEDYEKKINNIKSTYGKYLTYNYICHRDKKDLFLLIS
jgi:hypothetical protein